MNVDLSRKVVVITGAAQGIGRSLALGLAREGARIVVLARDRERAQAVVDEIADRPGQEAAIAVVADVGDEADVRRAVAETDDAFGRVDALINNAGWMPKVSRVVDADVDTLERVWRSNVLGCFLTTKHYAPLMVRGGGGRIIYMSSAIGTQAGPGMAPYGGTKAALNILNNVVHQELSDDGIRTVAIAPGLTLTPGMRNSVGEDHVERVAANYPGGRLGQPDDLVGLVAFLCSEAATHLSGTVVSVRPPVGR
jgi:NAD(P)-dependent dehydrogenase (short-subunit alcohol dehydrogenase family)